MLSHVCLCPEEKGTGCGLGGGGRLCSTITTGLYTKSVFIEQEGRTGSVLFETGTFFLQPKSSSKAQLLLSQRTIGTLLTFVLFFCFGGGCFFGLFCMIKCCLFIGSCAPVKA